MERKEKPVAVVGKPSGLKMRAFADDLLSRVTGKRIFTDLLTDSALAEAVAKDRKLRAGRRKNRGKASPPPVLNERSVSEAAVVYKALRRKAS